MKTMTVADVKTNFSKVLDEVAAGEKIAITYGRKKEIKALLIPNEKKTNKISLTINTVILTPSKYRTERE